MLDKHYQPSSIEAANRELWQQLTYQETSSQTYSIFLPPPNVTGTLHMGHAFNQTVMDVYIRHARMQGKQTRWIPGTDHAGIATQIVVERQLEKQGLKRETLGRKDFLEKVWQWKETSGNQINQQIRHLGSSIDWQHSYFTMDEHHSQQVIKAFVKLYEDGFIYKGQRLVNWDPSLQTAVSDLEVMNQEEQGHLWHIAYPLLNNPQQSIVVATTRPETLLGDVAIMVNPTDARYQHLIGQQVQIPVCGRSIPIIADEYVDASFGTGAVKVTPAHDFNDYQVAKRHQLPLINLFNLDATCNENTPSDYQGLTREQARTKILQTLEQTGQLISQKPHTLMIPRCERTNTIIEPMLTHQWFMDLTSDKAQQAIVQPALDVVAQGKINIVPNEWQNTYNHWLNTIQDWCVSRQLWWGHQIPAWYGQDGEVFVALNLDEAKAKASKAGYTGDLTQEDDVLDTWFSSAMVPFASLGGLNHADVAKFLPSSVLVTGYDIIFFWVARMVMMTQYFTGTQPFKDVYVHGLVRDADGKKMSKSEGNTLDPIDLIEGIDLETLLEKRTQGLRRPELAAQVKDKTKQQFPEGIPAFGTDALRMTFASLASLGRSINFDSKRCEGYLHFCNKLWNATRFIEMQLEQNTGIQPNIDIKHLSFADGWLLNRMQTVAGQIEQHLKTYRLDLMAQSLYSLIWDECCDWYIELAKVQMQLANQPNDLASSEQKAHTLGMLCLMLDVLLRFLHPIMPFITETIWQQMGKVANLPSYMQLQNNTNIVTKTIIATAYPDANYFNTLFEHLAQTVDKNCTDFSVQIEQAQASMQVLQDWVQACRQLRSDCNVSSSQKIPLQIIFTDNEHTPQNLQANLLPYLKTLAKLSEVTKVDAFVDAKQSSILSHGARMQFMIEIDIEAETARLNKQLESMTQEINSLNTRLSQPAFVDKAPAKVVAQVREQLEKLQKHQQDLQAQLIRLQA